MADTSRGLQAEEISRKTAEPFELGNSQFAEAPQSHPSVSEWKQQLGLLRQKTRGAIERLSEYLQRRKPTSADMSAPEEVDRQLTATLEAIAMRQDSLEAMLYARYDVDSDSAVEKRLERFAPPPEWAVQLQSVVADRLAGFESSLETFFQRMEERSVIDPDGLDSPNSDDDTFIQSDILPAVAPILTASNTDDSLSVMLGPTLCGAPELQSSIRWLKENVLEGNPQALALVGQLLVFRCATPDRKPSLLKDVGESYYRCFPKNRDVSHPFEDAIAAWSKQICDEAGLPNWVELVHPGERFDGARHSPVARGGVEVAEVLGWVVLREGGRVYSKALVQTR